MPSTTRVPESPRRCRRPGAAVCALLLSCAWPPLHAAGDDWRIAPPEASAARELGFELAWEGEPLAGRFRRFDGSIRFDPALPAAADFAISVSLVSVDLGNADLDQAVAEPLWFDSRRFATARFRGGRAVPLGEGRFRLSGELDLKGRRRPVALRFAWQRTDRGARLRGETRLDRRDFAIGDGEWREDPSVSYEVRVSFDLELVPAGGGHAGR